MNIWKISTIILAITLLCLILIDFNNSKEIIHFDDGLDISNSLIMDLNNRFNQSYFICNIESDKCITIKLLK